MTARFSSASDDCAVMEQICAPMNEVDDYNKRLRAPANGIVR